MSRLVLLILVLLVANQPVRAEAVRVTSGKVSGEGWIFDANGVCMLVTPRHVVEQNGRLTTPMLVDAAGIEGQGIDAIAAPDTLQVGGAAMDVARLRVVGALSAHCDDDLGYGDIGPTLDRVRLTGQPLYFEKVQAGGSVELVPAAVATINKDRYRFTVSTPPGAAQVIASDSGSPVRLRSTSSIEQGLPLGLLVEALSDTDSMVLRMDAIQTWFHAAPAGAPAADPAAPFRIVGWSGETPDGHCGPTNLLTPDAACGWRASPLPDHATVDVDLTPSGGDRAISRVTVRFEAGTRAAGVAVEARPKGKIIGGEAWDALTYCAASPGQAILACSFAPRTGNLFRIRIEGLNGGVRSLSLQ